MVKMINILEECKNAKAIGIGSHLRPDGDCVGACMGLYLYLQKNCPRQRSTYLWNSLQRSFPVSKAWNGSGLIFNPKRVRRILCTGLRKGADGRGGEIF